MTFDTTDALVNNYSGTDKESIAKPTKLCERAIETVVDPRTMLSIPKMHFIVGKCVARTRVVELSRTVKTLDSPFRDCLGCRFAQDRFKFVIGILGLQIMHGSSKPHR